ncbi:hypothetical protein [Kineosporia sp. NBRC 101731]|uniref:hypothetical protein n=1 Tax=Kineosporia sp. NBRC 101731 TaxID=3032199 RepID=UPI0025537381|nr:hypothetical protein [Kineosporia sp. NBRC 101731]
MSRELRSRLIEAGAIVVPEHTDSPDFPGGGEPGATDTVTARAYRHPALGERVVVRLVPETLGQAEDLALEFLGFEVSRPPVPLGTGRRQALGFPAWALINDPANGHHALALVKDIERLARQAKSRPGAAREGFDELAARLGASVPHFLPTFYEQAGRAFIAVDNKQGAATMFGKAREAERVYALPIDENRQRDVFLEFAFNGALNAKSLTQYAKDLAGRTDPVAAYELFRQVCAERVAGGLPPYAGMADDLRRLIKAAKLDQGQQEERVIADLLESPALPHAPLPFWKSYAPALKRLAEHDPVIRGRLLALFPRAEQGGTEDFWFDLLHEAGALAGLIETEGVDQKARSDDGSSGWLVRAAAWRARGWRNTRRSARLLDLVQRMESRLKAENQPLRLLGAGIDLDLLDLVLHLGLSVELPEDRSVPMFPLQRWRRDDSPGRRDLAALAEADWARQPMRLGLNEALRGGYGVGRDGAGRLPLDHVRVFYETRGTRGALATWLEEAADEVDEGGLPALSAALDRLQPAAHGEVFGVRPQTHARIAGVDVAEILARTLRIGLLDEFGWPALEQAVTEFPEPKQHPNGWTEEAFSVTDSWPELILHNKVMAIVVGPHEVLLRHTFRIPADVPGYYSRSVVHVDGQLLVTWQSSDGMHGYWSDRPDEVFRAGNDQPHHYFSRFGTSLPLPDGGRTFGGRPLLPGDRVVGKVRDVATDGSGWWRLEGEGYSGRSWREYDPATGDPGRRSRPAFFEAGLAAEGAELADDWCALAPLRPGLEGTPFGAADGLLGWRSVRQEDGSLEAVSVTGEVARLSARLTGSAWMSHQAAALGPIRMPGGGEPAALLASGRAGGITFTDGEARGAELVTGRRGAEAVYARGTAYIPPVAFWHALRARDENGSAVLRAITREQGRALLDGARKGKAVKAVRAVLPGIGDERLVLGVAGVAEAAAEQVQRITALPRPVTTGVVEIKPRPVTGEVILPEETPAVDPVPGQGIPVPPQATDADLQRSLGGLTDVRSYYWSRSHETPDAIVNLKGVVAAVTGGPPKKGLLSKVGLGRQRTAVVEVPSTSVDWSPVIGGLGALALRAGLATTPADDRAALLVLLAAVAQTPLAEQDGHWRRLRLTSPQPSSTNDVELGTLLPTRGGQAFAQSWGNEYLDGAYRGVLTAIEYVPGRGDFGPVEGFSIAGSREGWGWGGQQRLRQMLELVETRGPAPWRSEAVDELVRETGLTRVEASLLLTGLLRIDTYENNFLPKPVREQLGLKVAEAKAARDSLHRMLTTADRLHLLGAAMPEQPADLWEKGPDVGRLAQEWNTRFGRRVPVPDVLVADLAAARKNTYSGAGDASAVLQGMVAPESTPWLTTDVQCRMEEHRVVYDGEKAKNPGDAFRDSHLADTVIGMLWLAYRLPLGDPIRAVLPRVYEALRQRLDNPDLLLSFAAGQPEAGLDGLRQVYGLPPAPTGQPRSTETWELGGAGYLVSRPGLTQVYVRPNALHSDGAPLLGLAGTPAGRQGAALLIAQGTGLARLVDELRAESPENSGWLQDPLVSVPELVDRVSDRLGLDENAARLYLQLLALPDPTDKNVRLWNGWTPRVLKAATAALLGAGLVVEGQRARAGRGVFLPSAWLPVKAPGLPVEAWKVPMLGLLADGTSPLDLGVPVTSVRELYGTAWERVVADDGPRMDALRTGRDARR